MCCFHCKPLRSVLVSETRSKKVKLNLSAYLYNYILKNYFFYHALISAYYIILMSGKLQTNLKRSKRILFFQPPRAKVNSKKKNINKLTYSCFVLNISDVALSKNINFLQ